MRAVCSCHWAGAVNLCAGRSTLTYLTLLSHSKFFAPASDQPMPHAPCPMPPGGLSGLSAMDGRQDDIVMTPARWRCEISEALAPGRLPVHSSPPTASAGLPLPQAHHLAEGATDDCVTSLPARHPPSLSACGRHCRSTSNEASTPSPVGLLVWLPRVAPPPLESAPLLPSQPSPGTRRPDADDSRPHFAEIQISQNPTGWAPQRSLAPRTCRAPLPVCLSPSQAPSCRPLAVPQCRRGSRCYCTAERPWLLLATFPNASHRHYQPWTAMPANRHDGTGL